MYVELAAKTNYAFLESASHPEEMIETAAKLEYDGIAIVDTNGMYGIPRAHFSAQAAKLPLIVGSSLPSGAILLAMNRNGYGNLCEALSCTEGAKDPLTGLEDVYLILPIGSFQEKELPLYQERFPNRISLLCSDFIDGNDLRPLARAYTKKYQLPCVASNQPRFHVPNRKFLHDVLACIRHRTTLKQAGFLLQSNAERYLKSKAEMERLFKDDPQWLDQTGAILDQCRFSLDEIRYHYPTEWIPKGETTDSYLEKLTWEGATKRYPSGIPSEVTQQIHRELALIQELKYSDYFLTTWDIVRFARSQKILCQGRGSAANSTVCYVLGITSIDPVRMNLLFERFISRERKEPPDIDIDFEHERREEVIQYLYQRYGRHRAAITAEVISYRRKSAIREVAKVFGFDEAAIKALQQVSFRRSLSEVELGELQKALPETSPHTLKLFFYLAKEIQSFPRHLGTHVGGFVLSHDALNRTVPIEAAAMPDRTIVQWDKNDLDNLGFVRVDVLGLGMMTAIRKSFDYLRTFYDLDWDLASIPAEDPKVYERLQRADSIGVFQLESRAQMNMLPRLKPKTFYDLVVEIALVRPGPIQGKMIHPYLRRRAKKEPIQYAHPSLIPILKKTYGVPLFQEQIMKMAVEVAGFTPGEADQLRRAMGSWRRWPNRLTRMGEKFRKGLIERGIESNYADQIFHQIEGFAEYGFPESHSASFAILAYASAYLKCHYPDVFLCALLNSQPMGFYQSHSLIYDAIRHQVQVLPVDLSHSHWDNHLEGKRKVRLGFREIQGFKKATGEAIEATQREAPMTSLSDLVTRIQPHLQDRQARPLLQRDLSLLACADGFRSLGLTRRQALWEIQGLDLKDPFFLSYTSSPVSLPKESPWEQLKSDYEATGVSLHQHPMSFFRKTLQQRGALSSKEVQTHAPRRRRQRCEVAGLVIARQMPPTAGGVFFLTLEDEFGFINLVVWNSVFQRLKATLISESFLLCQGKLEKAEDGKVFHFIVDDAVALFEKTSERWIQSYDFH